MKDLCFGALFEHVHLKSLLARDDIDVNLQDGNSKTALVYAIDNGHHSIARLLMEYKGIGVTLYDQCETEERTLHCAVVMWGVKTLAAIIPEQDNI